MSNNYYRMVKLHTVDKGETFLYQNTPFELIYNEHAIIVGLTKDEFEHDGKKGRQVMTFKDDQEVLVKIQEPITNE